MLARLYSQLRLGFRTEAVFAAFMMAASAFGFLKSIGVARVLPPAEFGLYISYLGIATLLSIFSSLGRLETTYKLYPVMMLEGRGREMALHAMRLWLHLGLTIGASGACWFLVQNVLIDLSGPGGFELGLILLAGWLITGLLLVASMARGVGNLRVLQMYTFARGAIVLAVALPAAILSGSWRVTLLSETAAMAVLLLISGYIIAGKARRARPSAPSNARPQDVTRGGGVLYLAVLASATVIYGGRSFVLYFVGPAMAGAFGLLTLIAQVGVMLAGALAQKLGPQLIRDAASQKLDPAIMASSLGLMGVFSATITGVLLLSSWVPAGAAFWAHYDISQWMLVLVGLQTFLPCYLFLKFLLMAKNREGAIFIAAVAAALVFFVLAGLNGWFDGGLGGFVIAFAASELVRLVIKLFYAYPRRRY